MTDRKTIQALAVAELEEANEKYSLFHSPHEAYAVLLEEVDEVRDDMKSIDSYMQYMWRRVKQDENMEEAAHRVYNYAISLAQEAIQVAAMCMKVRESRLYNDK